MENTSIIALTRATTLERQMDIVANNVANMNTTGFKSEQPLFIEYVNKPDQNEKYSMVQDYSTLRDLAPGPITMTGNPLDVALEGDGYFTVDTIDGPRYTRGGNFSLDSSRQLVNAAGLPILDDTGNVITIPVNARDIRISPQGNISTEAGPLGKIGVVRFENQQFMTQLGSGLYQTNEKPIEAEDTKVQQGFLEGSNVNSVAEMTTMIDVNRQYQIIQNLLKTEHDRLRNAYSKLTKLS